jgi:hypothetical protein
MTLRANTLLTSVVATTEALRPLVAQPLLSVGRILLED